MNLEEKSVNPNILKNVKLVFLDNPNKGTLATFYACLINANIFVPFRNNDNPDYLCNGKNTFLPIFTNMEEVNDEYRKKFTWRTLTINDCLKIVKAKPICDGIAVDAFTKSFIIKNNFLLMLEDMVKYSKEK